MENKKQYLRLKVLFFMRYLGDAFFFSFLQLFLAYKGLSEINIAFINSLRPMLVLLMNPLFGLISKDVNKNRRIMQLITIIEGILVAFITKFDVFVVLTIFVSLISMLDSPFYTLLDGFTVSFTHESKLKYSNIRVFGSLAYVFGNLFGGLAIDFLGYEVTFIISGLFMIFTGLSIFFVKPLNKLDHNENKEVEKGNYKEILKNPSFYLYLLIYIGIVTFPGIGDSFISLYFLNSGLGTKEYGIIASLMIVVEVLTMYLYGKFGNKVNDKTVYIIIGIAYGLRSLLIGLDLPIYVTIPASLLRGVAWGLILCVHANFLRKIVGTKNVTGAIFILVLVSSIVQLVFLNVAGYILEKISYSYLYLGISLITILTTIFVVFTSKNIKTNQ